MYPYRRFSAEVKHIFHEWNSCFKSIFHQTVTNKPKNATHRPTSIRLNRINFSELLLFEIYILYSIGVQAVEDLGGNYRESEIQSRRRPIAQEPQG